MRESDRMCALASAAASPIVHLELHTGHLSNATSFLSGLLRWREECIDTSAGSYHALDAGGAMGAGVVECGTPRAMWLPYVSVHRVDEATERAVMLGARVLLSPREGPAGWRSVVSSPEAGEIALWQQKETSS